MHFSSGWFVESASAARVYSMEAPKVERILFTEKVASRIQAYCMQTDTPLLLAAQLRAESDRFYVARDIVCIGRLEDALEEPLSIGSVLSSLNTIPLSGVMLIGTSCSERSEILKFAEVVFGTGFRLLAYGALTNEESFSIKNFCVLERDMPAIYTVPNGKVVSENQLAQAERLELLQEFLAKVTWIESEMEPEDVDVDQHEMLRRLTQKDLPKRQQDTDT